MENIVIIGFMASGKSTLSKELSKKLNRFLIDSDEMIEKSIGRSIKDIFKENGEEYFRQKEADLFKILQGLSGCIISTGGGFCLKKVKKLGLVIWLDAPFSQIKKRLKALNDDTRPKATKDFKKLKKLYKKRKELYKKAANIRIKTKDLSLDEAVQIIIRKIKKHEN